tara:strand:- start:456 stop:992 length:537 start_codon:yes stop_codon:yes gene_type:complete
MASNVETYLERFASQVVSDAKKLLKKAKGNTALSETIRFKIDSTATGFDTKFYMDDYGTYLDEGVSGNKKTQYFEDYKGKKKISQYAYTTKGPPIDILSKWVKKKGLKPKGWGKGRDKKTGQYISGLAIYISNKIKTRGIPSISFFQIPLGIGLKKLDENFLKEVTLDIKRYLTTYTK